jgi:hypothetical protein
MSICSPSSNTLGLFFNVNAELSLPAAALASATAGRRCKIIRIDQINPEQLKSFEKYG